MSFAHILTSIYCFSQYMVQMQMFSDRKDHNRIVLCPFFLNSLTFCLYIMCFVHILTSRYVFGYLCCWFALSLMLTVYPIFMFIHFFLNKKIERFYENYPLWKICVTLLFEILLFLSISPSIFSLSTNNAYLNMNDSLHRFNGKYQHQHQTLFPPIWDLQNTT